MTVYEREFAAYYDLFYADKPYDREVEVADRLIRENLEGPAGRLLDIACGTGQHAIRFAARGWTVVGVDSSADMLRRAREKSNGAVFFVEQDMRQLQLQEEPFDAAVCLFDSIGYGITNDAIVSTLSGIRRHLRQGGLLVLEFWHAAAMLRAHDELRVREWEAPDATVLRVSRTALDVEAQLARVEYSVTVMDRDGAYRRWSEVHRNRYFLVQEMALILQTAAFEPVRWLAGFDLSAPIDESTWHVVAVARSSMPS
jgi:ubiquinone/menaquinone biosynthesis C-methylase UbiE